MVKVSKTSFKKVAAGALAVLSLAIYSLPANVGILSTRPTLSASATGTKNSIHVYGTINNSTGETLTIVYNDQFNGSTYAMEIKNNKSESVDGDITEIHSPVRLKFPTQWNQDEQKIDGTPHVDDITIEERTNDGYKYTFTSPKGNTYQYENIVYGKKAVVFTRNFDCTYNDAETHTLADGTTTEAHDFADLKVEVKSQNSDYYFEKYEDSRLSNNIWISNCYGTQDTKAETTWQVTVPKGHTAYLNYWVSCEENIDYLNIQVDGKEIARNASNGDTGLYLLGEGKHTVYAKYRHEDDPADEYNAYTCHFLDSAIIQFSNRCEKCDATDARAFLQFERHFKGDVAFKNGYRIKPTLTYANLGRQYMIDKNCSIYSNDVLWFECFDNDFTFTENVGSFKYNNKNYHFRYDINVPSPELGVFIKAWHGEYDDTNSLFTCKAKKGISTDLSTLSVDDFELSINPEIDAEEAEHLKAVLDSDNTVKWIQPYSEDSVYYVVYNPDLAEYDDYDDTIFLSSCIYDIGKYEITDENIVSDVDLITLDKDGKAYPNKCVKVTADNADGSNSALTEGTDYEFVSSASTSKSGEFTVEINGIGDCIGSGSKTMNVVAANALTKVPAKSPSNGVNGNIEYYKTADGSCYLPVTGYSNGYRKVSEEDVIIEAEVVKKPAFKTHNLILSGQIGVNFFMDLSSLTNAEKAASYVEFTVNGQTTKDNFDSECKNQSGTYYGFTCYVNSVQMADTITAVFHYGDETVTENYSVCDYISIIEKNAASYDKTTLNLIYSIADYGHYAQPLLAETNNWTIGVDHAEMAKHYTKSYDYAAIKDATKKYERSTSLVEKDIKKITLALSLDTKTDLNVFVAPTDNYTGSVSVSVDGLSENDYIVTKLSDGRYKIVISNIAAHELGDSYNINITTANGTSKCKASALSYVYAVLNSDSFGDTAKNTVSSIYKYYEAAMNYKNK